MNILRFEARGCFNRLRPHTRHRTHNNTMHVSRDSLQNPAPTDLEATARRVLLLEQHAEAAHARAQDLNKQGRFADAREAYDEMHRW